MIIRTKLTVRYLFKSGFCNVFDQVMIIDSRPLCIVVLVERSMCLTDTVDRLTNW